MTTFTGHTTIHEATQDWALKWISEDVGAQERMAGVASAMPDAREFVVEGPRIDKLGTAVGRVSLLNALLEHQASVSLDSHSQAFAGIEGINLVKTGQLFGDLNPRANESILNTRFTRRKLDTGKV